VRITTQLIEAETGVHLWADRFDGSLEDVFELQDKVASGVVGAIEPKLRQSEIGRAARKPTGNLDAYDLYLRALALRDEHTDESPYQAIDLLKQALAIDPAHAPAAALIGWSRVHQHSHSRVSLLEIEIAEAVAFARHAIQAGGDDPDALWMAASTLLCLVGECDSAAALADRALALNPNSAQAWMLRGWASFAQPDLAIQAFERAMRLSPLDRLGRLFTTGIANAHLVTGEYEEALHWADQTLRLEPDYLGALLCKAIACTRIQRNEEARAIIRQVLDFQPWRTVSRTESLYLKLFPPEIATICAQSLREAGMPE
jgi:adenylate cyclase